MYRFIITSLLFLCSLGVFAQMEEALAPLDYALDSAEVRELRLEVDNMTFFKDNEFDGNVVKGYSLPGFRLQPRLAYRPIPQISMELGVHATADFPIS